jgi:short-subunit dehydrogenase
MSHLLRRELQLSGIDVIVVGPRAVETAIWTKPSITQLGVTEATDYAPMMSSSMTVCESSGIELLAGEGPGPTLGGDL